MSKESPVHGSAKAERQQRLAAALRANLKRRKAQARGRPAGSDEELGDRGGADPASGLPGGSREGAPD
jgi:hypothetical protein